MMGKRIILFRHAKSDWSAAYGGDHGRPLVSRGEKDAARMGEFLASSGQAPDYVISSSAVRARTTLEIAKESGAWSANAEINDDLYAAHPRSVLKIIRKLPESISSVMLVGHDPTWSELVGLFIGGGNIQLKTASMACVDFELAEWHKVDFGLGYLAWFISPKLLR